MRKRLIILLLLLVGCLGTGLHAQTMAAAEQSVAPVTQTDNRLSETHSDRPQWENLGLRNLLTAGNESLSTAPASPKVQHQSCSLRQGDEPWTLMERDMAGWRMLPSRVIDYYVYCLLKLRL